MRILLCDDEPDILLVTAMVLEKIGGHQVIQAQGGQEAIEAAARTRPDAILVDVMMPDMDGPEVLARLRAQPETATTPVVFLTARTGPTDLERFREMGVKGVIAKPFDPFTVADQLSKILSE